MSAQPTIDRATLARAMMCVVTYDSLGEYHEHFDADTRREIMAAGRTVRAHARTAHEREFATLMQLLADRSAER